MKIGDICSMHGEDGNTWYGEIVGVKDSSVEVYFIEMQQNKLWKYSPEWYEVPKGCIITHISVNGNHKDAFRELGFNALDGTYFTKIGDPPADHVTIPMPTQDDDYDGPGEYEYNDFVVPDDEPFTFADPSIPFVKETHEAVREFEKWNPTEEGQKIKTFIETMDRRVCAEEDNRQFDNGKCLNFVKPPL